MNRMKSKSKQTADGCEECSSYYQVKMYLLLFHAKLCCAKQGENSTLMHLQNFNCRILMWFIRLYVH